VTIPHRHACSRRQWADWHPCAAQRPDCEWPDARALRQFAGVRTAKQRRLWSHQRLDGRYRSGADARHRVAELAGEERGLTLLAVGRGAAFLRLRSSDLGRVL